MASDRPTYEDDGYYTYYAGPVSVYAPNDCVKVTGRYSSYGYAGSIGWCD